MLQKDPHLTPEPNRLGSSSGAGGCSDLLFCFVRSAEAPHADKSEATQEPVSKSSAHGCVNKRIHAGVEESKEVDAEHGEEEILPFHEVLSLVLCHNTDQEVRGPGDCKC
ncbi:hypothetical protein TNIN_309431 [Trichonephila inaurata madagascariensis]|uniref:Uncharacterized protein n=1 Tax=Trichonephila inaurata madagascariensis TaxID=2747483 RepID=A0A8X6WPS8_9ARAC|nr:hypothetical protein TNIN_309431 [Trichonephila inaurata madagascariensis]